MFGFSVAHLLLVLAIILLLGGYKRLPELGGALGKGLQAFKKGLEGKNDDDDHPKLPPSV